MEHSSLDGINEVRSIMGLETKKCIKLDFCGILFIYLFANP